MGTPCHFALFDLQPSFRLDMEQLAVRYRELARQVHPDRFADAGEREQRIALERSACLNEAYQILKTPSQRARYLLAMRGPELPLEVIRRIIEGGESVCTAAGIPIAGGHTIDSVEPIYGLVALGLVHPKRVKRNADARPGDVLVLGKPLGVGVMSAALKKGALDAAGYDRMIATPLFGNQPISVELRYLHFEEKLNITFADDKKG